MPRAIYSSAVNGPVRRRKARLVGAVTVLLVLTAIAAAIALAGPAWFRRPCLILATVKEGGQTVKGSPVFYRGLRVGEVVALRSPSPSSPGWRLRMAVDCQAFVHISTDARVQLQPGRAGTAVLVVILPGLTPADPDYPLEVKVLSEVGTDEEAVRWVREVLDGLSELSQAKRSEAEVIELREEVERLRRRLAEMEARSNAVPAPAGRE